MTFKIIAESLQNLTNSDRHFLQKIKQSAAPFNFTVEIEYYNFSGVTYEEARKNMHIEAEKAINEKTEDGGIAVGIVKFVPLLASYKTFRYVVNRQLTTAYPVGMTLQASAKVILPHYNGIASPEDIDKIQKMVNDITKHEQVHVCIAVAGFNQVKQAALGINGKGKSKLVAGNDLNANIQKTFDAINFETAAKQQAYDTETHHGTKAAEQEKYNKTITAECDSYYEVLYK